MSLKNTNKIKLLKLLEILKCRSDKDNPLSASEILNYLKEYGIECDRRVLTKDIDLLNEYGYGICCKMQSHCKVYYTESRDFKPYELKLLIDAVVSADFICEEKTKELVEKVSALSMENDGGFLVDQVHFRPKKTKDHGIYDNIRQLIKALQAKEKISFVYFDLDHKGRRVYRQGGRRFCADPADIILREDVYYLMACDRDQAGAAYYRVDRMEKIEIIPQKAAEYWGETITETLKQVTLEFEAYLLDDVFDRFGDNIAIIKKAEGKYKARVRTFTDNRFYSWLFCFSGDIRIEAPKAVEKEYKEKLMDNILKIKD